ncbi:GntR family transcriptional regulator [Virgibacillus oceani]|uniref:LacI family transcriptional regulator n=1 Tax=Virgibacillus oceani TaxID=1479511 RepID=A0A917HLT4_9BACI|nr:GntR family transcriptional regulator [Virgibacillus oceani]GGG82692.1 LacI family transcriptional regulator [Virgibacillus oceani]
MSSLYEQIYNYILDKIKAGDMKQGDKIPTEEELAKQFNVSRITSKKALDLLSQKNVIDRFQGKGSYVSQNLPNFNIPSKEDTSKPEKQHDHKLIGLIIPDFTDTYGLDIVKAIEKRCSEHHYNLIIKRTFGLKEEEKKAIHSFVKMGVKGIIVLPVQGTHYNNELLRLVVEEYPLVLIDRYLKGIPASSVSIDNKKAMQQLTKLALDGGHQDIAFISPSVEGTSSVEERFRGFQAAFSERGVPLNQEYILTDIHSTMPVNLHGEDPKAYEERDHDRMLRFIQGNPTITAYICSEYEIAVFLSNILETLEIKNREDISIVCFDSPNTYIDKPFFTHIRQNQSAMGYNAVDLLIKQLHGDKEPVDCKVDFELVEGQSTRMDRLHGTHE